MYIHHVMLFLIGLSNEVVLYCQPSASWWRC